MTMLNWKNVLLQITFLSLLLKTFFFPFPQKCTLTDFFINNDSSDKFYIKFPGLFLLCFFIVFSFFCCVGCFQISLLFCFVLFLFLAYILVIISYFNSPKAKNSRKQQRIDDSSSNYNYYNHNNYTKTKTKLKKLRTTKRKFIKQNRNKNEEETLQFG